VEFEGAKTSLKGVADLVVEIYLMSQYLVVLMPPLMTLDVIENNEP